MDPGSHWVEKWGLPFMVGAVLWEFIRLRVRRQNEPQGAGRGYYLETSYYGNRSFYKIPFYIKNYRLRWGSNVEKFPLTKLPSLAVKNILQIMGPTEQIQLAISSKKIEQHMQMERLRTDPVWINVQGEYSLILFSNTAVFCGQKFYEVVQNNGTIAENITTADILAWRDQNLLVYRNMDTIFHRLQLLYHDLKFDILLDTTYFGPDTMKDVLSIKSWKNADNVFVRGKRMLTFQELDFIMEEVEAKKSLTIKAAFPANYKNDNAFKFFNIHYEGAHWVTLRDLMSLKNRNEIYLSGATLTMKSMNTFIKYWIYNKNDMFRKLHIRSSKRLTPGDVSICIRNLPVLKTTRENQVYYLFACRLFKDRKFRVMACQFKTYSVRLTTFLPNKARYDLKFCWKKEYQILTLLTRKYTCQRQLAFWEKKEAQMDRVEQENELVEIAEKKIRAREEIQRMETLLRQMPIHFENDIRAIMNER